jgi:hypothetical protein
MPQTDTSPIFEDEISLMQIIQQQPIIDRPRLEELRDRCEYGHLSPEEHQELMQYEDELERHNADRIEAIMHLAKLQNTDFRTLYQRYEFTSSTNQCPTASTQLVNSK